MQQLQERYPADEARALCYRMLQHVSGMSYTQLLAFRDAPLADAAVAAVCAAVDDLLRHKPWQYITGEVQFCGLAFAVNEAVMIPRPETEELVDWALAELDDLQAAGEALAALDLCTGSGCIAVSIAVQAGNVAVVACDISDDALAVARGNAQRHAANVRFAVCDVLQQPPALPAEPAAWHAILSNPPYVRRSEQRLMQPNVLQYEPHAALFVDDADPLAFYRAVADIAAHRLAPAGFVMVEINEALADVTAAVFQQAGFRSVQARKDVYGKDRFLKINK
jgi:release factor glutamine methyltransferase